MNNIHISMSTADRPRRAFITATEFERVAVGLGDKLSTSSRTHGVSPERLISESATYAMNQAFAFELYAKCLLMLKGKTPPNIHHLLDLLNKLPQSLQRAACRQYRIHMSNVDPQKTAHAKRDHGLRAVLRLHPLAFVKFRYLHETSAPLTMTTMPICLAIRPVILKLKPEWTPFATGLET
jgi:hypothetical protein